MPQVPRISGQQVSSAPLSLATRQATPSLLGDAGNIVSGFAEASQHLAENKRKVQVSSMLVDATKRIEEFHIGLTTDRDYDTQHERYEGLLQTINAEAQKGGDPQLSRLFASEFQPLASRKGFDIQRESLKGQISVQRASVDANLESIASLAGSGDPEYDNYLTERGEDLLGAAYENGVLTNAEELQDKASKFRSDVVVAGVRKQILDAPELAEKQLLGDGFKGLSGDARTVWTERAQSAANSVRRERVATEERQFRMAERREKDYAQVAERDGLKLQRAGSLSPEWIETNRDVLTPEAQRYFYRAMSGEDVVTDLRTYTDLRERVGRGENVADEARGALYASRIKREDYDRILGIQDRESVPGWFRRGDDFITNSLKPSDTNPDPAAPQRYAYAKDDWYQFRIENPDATDDQARVAYSKIVTDYRLVGANMVMIDGPKPTYLVGSRTQPDIDATEAATVEAFESGAINETEFNRQAALMARWRDAADGLSKQGAVSGDE